MARGYPDYQNPAYAIATRNVDMTDIITYLFGAVRLDGRGKVFWFDKFDKNMSAWSVSQVGAAIEPSISTDKAAIPPSSMLLDVGAAGSGNECWAIHMFPQPVRGRYGIETSLYLSNDVPDYQVDIGVHKAGGVAAFRLYYSFANNTIKLYSGDYERVVMEIGALRYLTTFVPVKLVFDIDNDCLVRFIYNDVTVDVSDAPIVYIGGTTSIKNYVEIKAISHAAPCSKGYCGYVIITSDEP